MPVPSRPAPRVDVACFGEILWDIFEAEPRAEEPIAWGFRRELGGAPANVATGLARLGVKASVIGGVGRDRFGDALLRQGEFRAQSNRRRLRAKSELQRCRQRGQRFRQREQAIEVEPRIGRILIGGEPAYPFGDDAGGGSGGADAGGGGGTGDGG